MHVKDIDHLSVSQINEYIGCSQQYFNHRIIEKDILDVSSNLIVGSAYHSAIEHYYEMKKSGVEIKLNEMLSVFEQVLKEDEEGKIINWGRSDCETEFKKAGLVLDKFLGNQENNEVLSVEEMFRFEIDKIPVPMIGRTDLIEYDPKNKSVIVVDFKSSATKPTTSNDPYVLSDIDSNFQMTLYQLMAKKKYPGKDIKLRMDYLIKSIKNPAYLKMKTLRTDQQEIEFTQVVKKVWNQIQMMRSGIIEPLPQRGWRCSGCGYRHLCQQNDVAA